MQPAVVDILVCLFCYSGNGGVASTIPQLVFWWGSVFHKMKSDPRIGRVGTVELCDTPITMTRNQALLMARAGKFDFVLMLDSDNEPDAYIGKDPQATPFWDTAFDLAYDRLMKGKQTIVAAPYGGPPPEPGQIDGGEVPYLFQWENNESDVERPAFKIRILTRNEAALMRGVHRVAALPTGVCLISTDTVKDMPPPWFYYEFDEYAAKKNSTEDVVFTRNASLFHQAKHGENVCFATCDSWAYHHKTKKVGRPVLMPVEVVAEHFRKAVLDGHHVGDAVIDVNPEIPGNARLAMNRVLNEHPEWKPPKQEWKGQPPPDEDRVITTPDEQVSLGTPIVHRSIGGFKITTDANNPLTEHDAAAITKLVNSIDGDSIRIVALNIGLGDSFAVMAKAAYQREQVSLFAAGTSINRDAYQKNWEGVGLPEQPGVMVPEVDPVPSDFDDQELDLLWCGSLLEDLEQIDAWLPHVRVGGMAAGVKCTLDAMRRLKDWGVNPQVIEESAVWFARIEEPESEEPVEIPL